MRTLVIISCICLCLGVWKPYIIQAEVNQGDKPKINSEAALLLDSETGAVLFEKNGYTKMYPASLTKIATSIYALEKGNLNDIVTVSENATSVDGTKVYLEPGEKVTLRHLIEGMLINSGNDAARAIAEYLDGSTKSFEQNFNKYLKEEIGVNATHFTNPSGLFDENHYTTANDLALITKYAMRNIIFREIFGTKELNWDGQSWDTTLITHHLMLKGEIPYKEVIGGKNGYVTESKQTLATAAQNDKMSLIAITLGGNFRDDVYDDTTSLLDYGFSSFQRETIPREQTYEEYGKTFYTVRDESITVMANQGKQEITPSGLLLIEDNEGNIIQTIHLKEKESIDPQTGSGVLSIHNVEKEESTMIPFVIGGIAAVIAISILLQTKIKKFKNA